jgi:hypothetical protein
VASAFAVMLVIAGGEAVSKEPSSSQTNGVPAELSSPRDENKTGTPDPEAAAQSHDTEHETLCLTVESAARANDLPLGFFARVIWQESRFRSDAVGR